MLEFIMQIAQLQDCGSSFLSYIFSGPGILQFSEMGAILILLAKVIYLVSLAAITFKGHHTILLPREGALRDALWGSKTVSNLYASINKNWLIKTQITTNLGL